MKKLLILARIRFPLPALLLLACLLFGSDVPVPDRYLLSKGYTVAIQGTSNLRDWQETVGEVTGEVVAEAGADGSVELRSIHIKMEVHSIKSDIGKVMDNKTYEALKADANPEILFCLSSPVKLTQVKDCRTAVPIKGTLTLAGVRRPVIMQVKTFEIGKGKLLFEGFQAIKMTDYGVKPPTALFGTMRASPDITITFKTSFIKQINPTQFLPIKQN